MKNISEYLINESYSWDAPSKKDMKTNIDKLIAFQDAFNYLKYYEGRHSDDVLEWVASEILNATDKELKGAEFYSNFDVEDEIYNFIEETDIEDETFEVDEIIDKYKKYLIEYEEIPEEAVNKIFTNYIDDIKKEFFDRDIISEF